MACVCLSVCVIVVDTKYPSLLFLVFFAAVDPDYLSHFLLTYRSFTTPDHILLKLVQKYVCVSVSVCARASHLTAIVLLVITYNEQQQTTTDCHTCHHGRLLLF